MAHIQKLPQDVINRIAAGEVVQRPSAALKELLENSLDAGSTTIQVTAQDGGLEVLQVCDDGNGIEWEDLPLLCERYATSKLRSFDDLQSIASFGFRGEALASVSYVAKVTVTTKTRAGPRLSTPEAAAPCATGPCPPHLGGEVAWRATYLDGQLTQPAQACAGNVGTVIRAERMFYNASVRRGALRASEEWSRVVDVVSRYALAFPHVGFSCSREGGGAGGGGAGGRGSGGGVVFPKGSDTLKNIRVSHGNAIASHLHPIYHFDSSVVAHMAPPTTSTTLAVETSAETLARVSSAAKYVQALRGAPGEGVFTIAGFASDSTLLNRKSYQCLFINNRLVESHAVRKCVEAVYSSVLTGGNKPFAVLFITVPAERLDVNVHPTKKEVCLLDEDLIIAKLAELLRACVLQAASARQLDMLKLQNTTAAALKAFRPTAPPATTTAGSASAQQTLGMLSGHPPTTTTTTPNTNNSQLDTRTTTSSSTEILSVLHDRAARGVAPSPLTTHSAAQPSFSSSQGAGRASANALAGFGNGGIIVAPCTVVRVEPQKGALDAFFSKAKTASSSSLISSEPKAGVSTDSVDVDADDDAEMIVPATTGTEDTTTATTASPSVLDWQSVLDSIRPVTAPSKGTADTAQGDAEEAEVATRGEADEDEGGMAGDPTAAEQAPPASAKPSGVYLLDDESDDEDENDKSALLRDFQRFRERTAAPPTDGAAAAAAAAAAVGGDGDDDNAHAVEVTLAVGETPMKTTSLLVGVPEVETHVLTSVAAIAEGLRRRSSAAAQSFFQHLALVGVVDANAFMAQSGTSLYLLDTLRLVREVVFQRLFLRWADPGLPRMAALTLSTPPSVESLLLFALAHDGAGMAVCARAPLALREAAVAAQHERQGRKRTRPAPLSGLSVSPTTNHLPTSPAERRRKVESLLHDATYRAQDTHASRVNDEEPEGDGEASALAALSCAELAAYLFTAPATKDEHGESAPTPTKSARRYVKRLVRRLSAWRDMLSEYFDVVLSADGRVLSLPYVLNISWPPNLRALPLFLWLLAEDVPFPTGSSSSASPCLLLDASPWAASLPDAVPEDATHDATEAARAVEEEVQCFTAIAKHVADTLYGITSLPVAAKPSAGSPTTQGPPLASSPESGWLDTNTTALPTVQEGVEMALMPCLKSKRLFYPPAVLLSDGTLQSIVCVESLYKVFERC